MYDRAQGFYKSRLTVRLDRVEAGDVVLLHDSPKRHNHPDATLSILPNFLAHLRSRGLVSSVLSGARAAAPRVVVSET